MGKTNDTENSQPVLIETEFVGVLKFDKGEVPVNFRVSSGADCRLQFDINTIPVKYLSILPIGENTPGQSVNEFALAGESSDGKSIRSDRMRVLGHEIGNEGCQIHVAASTAKLTIQMPTAAPRPLLRLWFRSYKSFRNPVVETNLGRLAVEGGIKGVDLDDMSGNVALEANSQDPGPDWFEKANEFLRHMHRGLAVARGGRLQTPRLDYIRDEDWESEFFDGSGFKADLPIQHFLNQGPYIEALVRRYEEAGPVDEVFWSAIGWMHIDTTYHEVRFLTALTAIELLVNHAPEVRRGTVIPKKDFSPLRSKLEGVVDSSKSVDENVKRVFRNKLTQLNMKPLAQKVDELFDYYDIPRRDFEGDAIRDMVNLRNEIVHRGTVPDGVDIWPNVLLARELIVRIFLRQIGYDGDYLCYVDGFSTRKFPPTTKYVLQDAESMPRPGAIKRLIDMFWRIWR